MPEPGRPPCFRFAPSPNGRLHLGHAYSALLNATLAERTAGRFLVRLEDIDTVRCTPALSQHCLDDLAWLGLGWEEPVRRQSQHFATYAQALLPLKAHRLVYPCFCTRRKVEAHARSSDPDGAPLYPGLCATMPAKEAIMRINHGEPHGWRLSMERALGATSRPLIYERFDPDTWQIRRTDADPGRWGDAILARKDVPTSYHLSVVVDDAIEGVSHIVRGADLEAATDLHVLLQILLSLPTPLYHHHPLLKDASGWKLAKSRGSETLACLRMQGLTPQEIRRMLALPS